MAQKEAESIDVIDERSLVIPDITIRDLAVKDLFPYIEKDARVALGDRL